ncbi:hypothetical protein EJB05_41841, partial [Eragrostis curvula]
MSLPCLARLRLVPILPVLLQLLVARSPPAAVAAWTSNNLTAGGTLTPPGYITSPSGVFAFGFRALDSDPTKKFLLATWFRSGDNSSSSSDPRSVVWFAKQSPSGDTPVATAQSVLNVTADGALVLTDGASRQPLWTASTTSGTKGSSVLLALGDSGNLQLLGGDGSVLWESFRYPTDTLLPGQSLSLDDRSQGKLFSKRADEEFITGRFSMGIQADGNVVLDVDLLSGNNSGNAYWQAYSNSPDGINTTVTFDDRGRLNYTLHNGTVRSLITPSPATTSSGFQQQLARMDPDGIVRTYAHSTSNASWYVSGAFPGDGCNKRTACAAGPGSFCVETSDRLQCQCPAGYNYTDAQHSDSGCAPGFEPQSCGGGDGEKSSDGDEFALVELPGTTWESSIYYKKFSSVTEDQCRDHCLGDCFCAAALVIGGSDECVELAALTNGRQANDVTTKALIKVPTGTPTPRTRTALAAVRPWKIVTVCLALLLAITVGGGVLAHHCLVGRRNRESQQRLLTSSVRAFTWKELHQATNGFEKLLGKGSFGEVCQGTTRSPEPLRIAVKRLIDSNEYVDKEFTNEVQSIGRIHHRNLVRMLGYCKEGRHRMLVFEYMPGGSLRGAAVAIARGLEYLHDGCASPIIHCDIKPDNILLDGRGVPRITDFGISKLLGSHQVHATVTNVRGTRGYIAPEWLRGDARVDTKADVYSFGVVLLEMVCCRRCQEPVAPDDLGGQGGDETVTLFGWAAQLVTARKTELMLHEGADAAEDDLERVERFARVALWCVEPNPALRPTMHQVVQMLEGRDQAQDQALPDPPACYMESSPLIPQLTIQ